MRTRNGFLFAALGALVLVTAAAGQPVKDPCLVQPVPQVMPVKADAKGPKLGRAVPQAQFDYGRFRAVRGSDGKTRFFPRLSKHLNTGRRANPLPTPVDYSAKAANVLKRMYLNDQYGCCVLSSRYHGLGFQTAADTGTGIEADDQEVYNAYQAACGRGDNGCDMSAVCQYQQSVGLKVKGVVHKIDGSVSIDNTNPEIVKAAIYVFGTIDVGMLLPNDWYQSADGADWGPTRSAIVGGHEVQACGYDDKGVFISTWGGKRRILWAAFTATTWIDETYTSLSPDWYGSDKLAPSGIDATTLKADLALIAGGQVPPLPPVVPPTPPTPPNPKPGTGFTGAVVTTQNFVDGIASGPPILSIGAPAGSGGIETELKDAGVSPNVIVDVLKLLADLKAKAPRATILADILAIVADFTAANPEPKAEGRYEVTPRGERHARREEPVTGCRSGLFW